LIDAVSASVTQDTLVGGEQVPDIDLAIEHNHGHKQPLEFLITHSPPARPTAFFPDTLFCHESGKYPENTLVSTWSPDTTADSFDMSVPVDVNYPPTDSETLRSRKDHELLLGEIRRSLEEHGEHPDVFSSQYTTTDGGSSSSDISESRPFSTQVSGPEQVEKIRETAKPNLDPLNGDAVYPPTDDDASDEDELTSGGEEDIMAQFGSGKKMAGFVNALEEGAEGSQEPRDEKACFPLITIRLANMLVASTLTYTTI